MASFTPSNWAKAQALLQNKFDTEARKYRIPHTFLRIAELTSVMMPDHKEIRLREDRTVEAYTAARTERTLGTARAHDHTGAKGDSLVLTPSWAISSDTWSISLKQGDNNVFSYEQMLAKEMENAFKNFAVGLEVDAMDFIFALRSQINVSTTQGSFDGTDFVFNITESTEGKRAVQITKTVMEENDLHGPVTFFCDSQAFDKFNFDSAQGNGNSENLSFQYENATFVRSIGLEGATRFDALVGTYTKGVWIVVPDDTLASLDWIPKQNRMGMDTKEQIYMSAPNPFIGGITQAVHKYAERSDQSSLNGETQDELEEWETSLDIAFVAAPVTTATESVAQAFSFQ